MIPLYDEGIRRRRFPIITVTLIALNALVFFFELSLGPRQLQGFVFAYGAIPLELITGQDLPPPGPPVIWFTFVSSMFIHEGWAHFGGNMLYLWVFGDNVEDTLGRLLYIFFYFATGLAASLAHILTNLESPIPAIGASGAISGVLGAYLLLFPRARVNALVIFGFFIRIVPVPALMFLGFWFILQLFTGVASFGMEAGVAYWAHIGGFVAGVLLALPAKLRQGPLFSP